jgi:predicted nucleic acid-binding protein
MKDILLDTNIILDIALRREPHFIHASKLFDLIDEKLIKGYITATSLTDIYYIARKEKSRNEAKEFIFDLIKILEVLEVDKAIVQDALASDIDDFEDGVQVYAAKYNEIKTIVTRNKKDFQKSRLEILTPKELIQQLK